MSEGMPGSSRRGEVVGIGAVRRDLSLVEGAGAQVVPPGGDEAVGAETEGCGGGEGGRLPEGDAGGPGDAESALPRPSPPEGLTSGGREAEGGTPSRPTWGGGMLGG